MPPKQQLITRYFPTHFQRLRSRASQLPREIQTNIASYIEPVAPLQSEFRRAFDQVRVNDPHLHHFDELWGFYLNAFEADQENKSQYFLFSNMVFWLNGFY